MKNPLFIAAALLFSCQIAFGDTLTDGIKAFEIKNDKSALTLLLPLADKGSAVAQGYVAQIYGRNSGVPQNFTLLNRYAQLSADQGDERGLFNLGVSYYFGEGVEKNLTKAFNLFKMADEKGSSGAADLLGQMYQSGNGVAKDLEKSMFYYEKSANQNHANGQLHLGSLYEAGLGTTQDYEQALKWFRRAAEQNNVLAQSNLGIMYETGKGVVKDYEQAAKWHRRAAELGGAVSQLNLGYLYYNGWGVTKDKNQAIYWYRKAEAQGNNIARNNLDAMKKEEEEQKIREAQLRREKAELKVVQMQEDSQNKLKLENCQRAKSISVGASEALANHYRVSESSIQLIRAYASGAECIAVVDTPKGPVTCNYTKVISKGNKVWLHFIPQDCGA